MLFPLLLCLPAGPPSRTRGRHPVPHYARRSGRERGKPKRHQGLKHNNARCSTAVIVNACDMILPLLNCLVFWCSPPPHQVRLLLFLTFFVSTLCLLSVPRIFLVRFSQEAVVILFSDGSVIRTLPRELYFPPYMSVCHQAWRNTHTPTHAFF